MLPNKRAVIALKESSVSCPGGDGRFVHYPCADRRVARSLRAIRYAASLGAMPRFASAVVVSRVPFFTLLGLVGALCGLVLALLGVLLRPTRRERAPSSSRDDVA